MGNHGVWSFGSRSRSLSCKRVSRSGGFLCWRVIDGLGRVGTAIFCGNIGWGGLDLFIFVGGGVRYGYNGRLIFREGFVEDGVRVVDIRDRRGRRTSRRHVGKWL